MMIMISQPTLPELEIDQYMKQMMCSFVMLNRRGHRVVYTCVRRWSMSWVHAWPAWPARLYSARRISLCALVFCSLFAASFYSVHDLHWRCCAFAVTSCDHIDFTFALLLKTHLRFLDSFLRFPSMARQLCGAGARASARLPTIFFSTTLWSYKSTKALPRVKCLQDFAYHIY